MAAAYRERITDESASRQRGPHHVRPGEGSTQVAAAGWPLYYFAPDENPGDANGQGVNDVWWVLRPDGTPVRQTNGTTTTDGGSYY
ncbi:hypothetical protein [Haladaptatus sp. GCM10025893]|uniref:COG4315 family predicted lipoprotein n=1 Tax=Haladaptatus sp. GCM10025893 TaxID=3252659 RepID=UPI00361A577F